MAVSRSNSATWARSPDQRKNIARSCQDVGKIASSPNARACSITSSASCSPAFSSPTGPSADACKARARSSSVALPRVLRAAAAARSADCKQPAIFMHPIGCLSLPHQRFCPPFVIVQFLSPEPAARSRRTDLPRVHPAFPAPPRVPITHANVARVPSKAATPRARSKNCLASGGEDCLAVRSPARIRYSIAFSSSPARS